ncbi:hypothetical protein Tco_0468796 [Tanacetum coccineum]
MEALAGFHLHSETSYPHRMFWNIPRIMLYDYDNLVSTVCERQDKWKCVLTRLIDDLLALDSKVRFDISDRRLELTATFSIPTYRVKTLPIHSLAVLEHINAPPQSLEVANISEPSTNEAIEISEVSSDLYLSTKYLDEL